MMKTVKDKKVKEIVGVFGSHKFKVVEVEYQIKKPNKVVNEETLFKGSILECEVYLRLLNNNNFISSK